MRSKVKIELVAHDYHRNGICGEGFRPILFDWKDADDSGETRRMLAILLSKETQDELGTVPCFVLDVDMVANGNIRFFENSWRGDHFSDALRTAIAEAEATKGAADA